MSATTITIGWTIHLPRNGQDLCQHCGSNVWRGDTPDRCRACGTQWRPYWMPFWDTWKPGMPQHELTVEVELSDELHGQRVADAVFHATNAPEVAEDSNEGRILAAIQATGYRGHEAHWSLSVGDTVTVGGVRWACAKLGWELVPATTTTSEEQAR